MGAVESGEEPEEEEEEEADDGVEKVGEDDWRHFWRGRVMLSYTGAAATQLSLTCR